MDIECERTDALIFDSLLGENEWNQPMPHEFGNQTIPLYKINSCDELNRLIGYARFQYANEGKTILYRGQPSLFKNALQPSIARERENSAGTTTEAIKNLKTTLNNIKQCTDLRKCLIGPRARMQVLEQEDADKDVIEGCIQHYGCRTRMIDLVDNHWIALWFATVSDGHPVNENAYVLLYAADTSTKCCNGVYKTEEMTTIDLRKAVSSIFLRPAAQHAWVSRLNDAYDYSDAIVGIIEIQRKNALNMLGIEGDGHDDAPSNSLLNHNNLFPAASEERDKGWYELLKHQTGTPQNEQYHAKQCLTAGTIAIE